MPEASCVCQDKRDGRGNEISVSCQDPCTIHTIGHSTRTIDDFIELLKAHRIEFLVDVRRWPTSRRFPHFAREALTGSLKQQGRVDGVWSLILITAKFKTRP